MFVSNRTYHSCICDQSTFSGRIQEQTAFPWQNSWANLPSHWWAN